MNSSKSKYKQAKKAYRNEQQTKIANTIAKPLSKSIDATMNLHQKKAEIRVKANQKVSELATKAANFKTVNRAVAGYVAYKTVDVCTGYAISRGARSVSDMIRTGVSKAARH